MKKTKYIFYIISIKLLLIYSCGETNKKNNTIKTDSTKSTIEKNEIKKVQKNYLLISLKDTVKTNFVVGDDIYINLDLSDSINVDSIQLFVDNKYIITTKKLPETLSWNSKKSKVGNIEIEAILFVKGQRMNKKINVVLFSDIIPVTNGFKIINAYPHDIMAYTQGLLYENGFIYEATGIKEESTLRKVKLESGEILQSITVPGNIFGEGITIFNNKIIQLSWQSNIGYIYEKETFKLIGKFNYYTEGWGLTNDGTNLIMSDGTHNLYFLDTHTYSQIKKIEVFDNNGIVNNLNELEYINGEIFANIYLKDIIARIDPVTGKVLAYINLKNILSKKEYKDNTDVLNGIAYDYINKRLFVTGKKWPKMFEIEIK